MFSTKMATATIYQTKMTHGLQTKCSHKKVPRPWSPSLNLIRWDWLISSLLLEIGTATKCSHGNIPGISALCHKGNIIIAKGMFRRGWNIGDISGEYNEKIAFFYLSLTANIYLLAFNRVNKPMLLRHMSIFSYSWNTRDQYFCKDASLLLLSNHRAKGEKSRQGRRHLLSKKHLKKKYLKYTWITRKLCSAV